jgi:lysophospholipid acyltransferase (LPLAT)-like uncharacterized protein
MRDHSKPQSQSQVESWQFKMTLWILYVFCRVLAATWRVRVVGMDRRRRGMGMSRSSSVLIASFHENSAAGILSHPGQKICTMVSHSKDGEIVAFIAEKFGLTAVRGSSSRGAKEVRDAMVATVLSGVNGAITVDGPRGPRRILKNGIVDIARKSGAPVLPITCIGSPCWTLAKTWDQTRIPKPFSRLLVYYGEPIWVPGDTKDEGFQSYLNTITEAMNRDDDLVRLRFNELWSAARRWEQIDV